MPCAAPPPFSARPLRAAPRATDPLSASPANPPAPAPTPDAQASPPLPRVPLRLWPRHLLRVPVRPPPPGAQRAACPACPRQLGPYRPPLESAAPAPPPHPAPPSDGLPPCSLVPPAWPSAATNRCPAARTTRPLAPPASSPVAPRVTALARGARSLPAH
eukprot:5957155-Pleurochrysis_carterae.AAC.2